MRLPCASWEGPFVDSSFAEPTPPAVGRVADEHTAFNGRAAGHTFNITGMTATAEGFDAEREWVRSFWSALEAHHTSVYVNFLMEEGQERIRQAYGPEKYQRLRALKGKYDPDNFFRLNRTARRRRARCSTVGAGQDAGAVYPSVLERPPTLDQGKGRAPSARLGQLALGLSAHRFKLPLAQCLKQSRLERGAELKRQTQVGVAWFERDHVCVDFGLLDTDFPEQLGKFAARLAAQAGKDLREQSDQSLGRGCRGIEVPRAQVPLLQNE